ncbi:MAG: hypothetical protein ACHQ4H_01185, partial [Ktedonobacterales bacterium]
MVRDFLVGLDAFYLLVFAVFALVLPALTRRDLLFGVTVPPDTRSAPAGRAIVRGYRWGVAGLSLLLAVALALLWLFAPQGWWDTPWMAVAPVAFALFPDLPYLLAYRAARRLAARSPHEEPAAARSAPAAELVPRRYGDEVPWLWETLPLAVGAR